MGKAAMLAIVAFGVMGTYYTMGTQSGMKGAQQGVVDHQMEVLARNAALVGHDRAEQVLSSEFLTPTPGFARTFSATYEGVRYEAQIASDGAAINLGGLNISTTMGTAAIVSVAYQENAEGEEVPVYRVETLYEREMVPVGGGSSEAPAFMQAAITAGGDVTLSGNASAGVEGIDAEGDERNRLNANVHANGVLRVNGNVDVEGFGTTARYADIVGNVDFKPNYNPTDAPSVQEGVVPVDIPLFNAEEFLDKMDGADDGVINSVDRTSTGDLQITRNYDYHLGGTQEDPYIWYVKDGMLELAGNVSFSGYILFVAEEGFKVTGNVSMGKDFDGPQESNIAIYTGKEGTIDFAGNMTLYGQIFAAEGMNFDGRGNIDIFGSITTGGDVTLKGNAEIKYRSPSGAFWPTEKEPQINVVAHQEW